MPELGHFYDENGIFGGQSDERHNSDLRVHIVCVVAQKNAKQGAEDAQRNCKDDGEWQSPAAIQGGEEKEHEHGRKTKCITFLAFRTLLLIGCARPFIPESGRKLGCDLLHDGSSLAGAVPGSGAAHDLYGTEAVITINHLRADNGS